jgi:hypothetical protein
METANAHLESYDYAPYDVTAPKDFQVLIDGIKSE